METKAYFDYNATTPLSDAAKLAWLEAADTAWLNPSSPYRAAARVHARMENARESFAEAFAVEPQRVVFNSGATEGNNAVFAHWQQTLPKRSKVAVSPTEHPSVIESAKHFFKERVLWLALDEYGAVDIAALADVVLAGEVVAVSVMAANNETGILNPWQKIAEVCAKQQVAYHCDASQWIGKLPLDGLSNCDYVTGCAHKFGGPRGVGFLMLPQGAARFQSLHGGAQQGERRAGTEDVAGVLAMLAAFEAATCGQPEARDAFMRQLQSTIPEVQLVCKHGPRLWNTASVLMPEFASERWIRALEKRGFLVSAGSACSSGKEGPSHVLAAMGVDATVARRVLRMSSGSRATAEDWSLLADAIQLVYDELRSAAEGSTSRVITL
ncbi:MAG TPA: cysteine desulfurase [Opitutae bacterium]|nr:cysteine desulfurase [Opitutae bacterium]